jgi:glycosyltransferase involved in cell wall biosynthesis
MINLMVLQQESRDGCSWYRIKQFVDHANETKKINCYYTNPHLPSKDLFYAIKSTDIFFSRLSEYTHFFLEELKNLKQNKLFVLDIDDNYEEINPFSNHYETMGVHEIQLHDGTWLWKDKESNFDIDENRKRHAKYKEVLKSADVIIVTTPRLAEYARKYNPVALIIPNAINFSHFPDIRIQKPSSQIDIVWSGGSSHYIDLMTIAEPLKKLMHSHPNLHYHHVGQLFKGFIKDLPEGRTHIYPWVDTEAHGYRLATLGADIGLCPLEDIEFNKYKSSVKFYEYASCGIATVARNIPPYSDDINSRNGVLYETGDDWLQKMEELIKDPLKRLGIAREGREYVMNKRNISDIGKDWCEALLEMRKAKLQKEEEEWEG